MSRTYFALTWGSYEVGLSSDLRRA
eukprot:COSAG02_NODE_46785_length_346_cov_0.643725_1_plen_24_part_01